jgi:hypothetical protein
VTTQCRALTISILILLLFVGSGCASDQSFRARAKRWGVRGVGAVTSFALHEACHVAMGAALGGDVSARWDGGLVLGFSNLSPARHQAVAFAGSMCTGIAAELIVDFGWHEKSDVAWGMAAFHAVNSFGYAFSSGGDSQHWRESGGSTASWTSINALHGTRIGGQLAWDAGVGNWVVRFFQPPAPRPPHIPPPTRRGVKLPSSPPLIASIEETLEPSLEIQLELIPDPYGILQLDQVRASTPPGEWINIEEWTTPVSNGRSSRVPGSVVTR